MSLPVEETVHRVPCGQEGRFGFVVQFIVNTNCGAWEVCDHAFDDEYIVVVRPLLVFAVGFNDRQADSLFFHLRVRGPQFAEQFRSAAFEELEISCIIDHTHLIGISINHSDFRFPDNHSQDSIMNHLYSDLF